MEFHAEIMFSHVKLPYMLTLLNLIFPRIKTPCYVYFC